MDKQGIANQIKAISFDDVEKDMNKFVKIGKMLHTIGPRSRIAHIIVLWNEMKNKHPPVDFPHAENLQGVNHCKSLSFVLWNEMKT